MTNKFSYVNFSSRFQFLMLSLKKTKGEYKEIYAPPLEGGICKCHKHTGLSCRKDRLTKGIRFYASEGASLSLRGRTQQKDQ